jgi:hypothetical protein
MGLFLGENGWSVRLAIHLNLVPRLRRILATLSLDMYALKTCARTN